MSREYKGHLIEKTWVGVNADQGDINEARWDVLAKGGAACSWKEIIRSGFRSDEQAEAFIDELVASQDTR